MLNNKVEQFKEDISAIFVRCDKCGSKYVQKYWDKEINWYIEINNTKICVKCGERIIPGALKRLDEPGLFSRWVRISTQVFLVEN